MTDATTTLDGAWEFSTAPDSDPWRPVVVPSAWWSVAGPDVETGWYRRRLPALDARRTHWLRFESVATMCRGWVDGTPIGAHVGDWVPFQWRLPAGCHGGELVLRVESPRAARPARAGDLQNGHITKGFHDVISIAHRGIWQSVSIAALGSVCAAPDGVWVRADLATGGVRVAWTLDEPEAAAGEARVTLRDPSGAIAVEGRVSIPGGGAWETALAAPRPWCPADPALYTAEVELVDTGGVGERHVRRFGFRRVEAVGRRIHLNGVPIQLRGVLDWGHEPVHLAPAPTEVEIRARFEQLLAMGFNLICVCMWYPPRAYYRLADELGLMVWQEHPVWQSPMGPEHRAAYQAQYARFLARDRHHPSIVVASATCEHPSFDPELGAWWWDRARAELPDTLLQLQTAFFRWADPERTDLHDEHTYESSDRWVPYLDDLAGHLAGIEPKPFVMGETVLFTSWPEMNRRDAAAWWTPRGSAARLDAEDRWRARFGAEAVDRLRADGDRFHLLGRKFQVEMFRRDPDRAGLVMNHLRDVPPCQCGFMDNQDRWRFAPAQCRPWLADTMLVLETPDQRRAFTAGTDVDLGVALSNFGPRLADGPVTVTVGDVDHALPLVAAPGSVARAALPVTMPAARGRPVAIDVRARGAGAEANAWTLWSVPAPAWPAAAARVPDAPLDADERASLPTERAYSKGYGLDARSWSPRPPEVQVVAAELPECAPAAAAPGVVLVAHRLTPALRRWIESGGRAIVLAGGARDSIETAYEWLFGQVPLVVARGPLEAGDRDWIVELLGYDLVRRWCRVVPSDALGQTEAVEPLIRCAYTHDQAGVRELDLLYHQRLGSGRLLVSSLDHGDPIGRWLLARCAAWLATDEA